MALPSSNPLAITSSESGGETPDRLAQQPGVNPLKAALSVPTAKRGSDFQVRSAGGGLPGRVGAVVGVGLSGLGGSAAASGARGYNLRSATDAIIGVGQNPGFAEGLEALNAEDQLGSTLEPLDFRPSNRLHQRIIGVAGLAPTALPPPAGSFPPGSTAVMPPGHGSAANNPGMHARVYPSAPQFSGVHVASPEERKEANVRGRSGVPQCPSGAVMGGAVILTRAFNLRIRGGAITVPAGTVVVDPGEIYLLETQRAPMKPYDIRQLQSQEKMPWEVEEVEVEVEVIEEIGVNNG